MKQSEQKQKAAVKYLEYLRNLKTTLSYGGGIALTKYTEERGIQKVVTGVLHSKKIIINTGTGKYPFWIWNTIEPNLHMARAVHEEICKKQRGYQSINKRKVTVTKTNEKGLNELISPTIREENEICGTKIINKKGVAKETIKSSLKVTMLWGLFKMEKNN